MNQPRVSHNLSVSPEEESFSSAMQLIASSSLQVEFKLASSSVQVGFVFVRLRKSFERNLNSI